MSDNDQFAKCMGQVAERVLGEAGLKLNKKLSSATEQRYGTNGSLSVDLSKGVYADHEDASGGGVLDLLRAFKGLDKAEAVKWLVDGGFIKEKEQEGKPAAADKTGKFMGFMEHHPLAIFKYQDRKGNPAYEVLKFPKEASRRYMQRRPLEGGWVWGLQAGDYGRFKNQKEWWRADPDKVKEGKYEEVRSFEEAERFLYNHAEVKKAIRDGVTIYLLEGEKDCETLREWGLVATTNAGGAKYWSDAFYDDLKGAHLVILPDNDDAGRTRVLLRGGGLKGKAASVKVLDLALHWPDMPEKKDVTDWKEMAGGKKERFAELVSAAPAWKPVRAKSSFRAFEWDELDTPGQEVDFLIDDFITERGVSVIGGAKGSGKSFLALHMAMCVCREKEFFGRFVKRGAVVYQAGEGGLGVKKRFRAYRKHFSVPADEKIDLLVMPARIDLFAAESTDVARFIDEIKVWRMTIETPLRWVVIDTFATATPGADENSGKDIGGVLKKVSFIEEQLECNVCLVHHMNADGKKLRGHTSIGANVDQILLIEHNKLTKVRRVVLDKQKDGEDGLSFSFELGSIEVGYSQERSKSITSCVVLPLGDRELLKSEQAALGFSPNQTERRILSIMFAATERYGKLVVTPIDGPKAAIGKTVIKWDMYRDVALETMPEVENREQALDQLNKEFKRAKTFLINAGVIGVENTFIWWAGKPVRGFWKTFPKTQKPDGSWTQAGQEPDKLPSAGLQELLDNPELEAPF
jgi:AAA domain